MLQFMMSLNYNSSNLIWFKNKKKEIGYIRSEKVIEARNLKQDRKFKYNQFKILKWLIKNLEKKTH